MKEKAIVGLVNDGLSLYTLLSSLMIASASNDSKLAPEQKLERQERVRLAEELRIKQVKIVRNECPDCSGKLSRGRKDKRNNYKRMWVCKDCGSSHSL